MTHVVYNWKGTEKGRYSSLREALGHMRSLGRGASLKSHT